HWDRRHRIPNRRDFLRNSGGRILTDDSYACVTTGPSANHRHIAGHAPEWEGRIDCRTLKGAVAVQIQNPEEAGTENSDATLAHTVPIANHRHIARHAAECISQIACAKIPHRYWRRGTTVPWTPERSRPWRRHLPSSRRPPAGPRT